MYRCTFCTAVVPAGTRQHLVITTRPVRYPYRWNAHPMRGVARQKWHDDPGGTGREIARAAPACPTCAADRAAPAAASPAD